MTKRFIPGKLCEIEGCKELSVTLVYDKEHSKILQVCEHHADDIVNYESPEYIEYCPNCGCEFGVN